MKQKYIFTKYISALSLCLMLGACSSEDLADFEQAPQPTIEQETVDTARHTVQMKFVGDVETFDKKARLSKAASSTWANGDKIYITFYNGSTTVKGDATYNSTTGWKVTYDGTLATGTKLKSEVRYFENLVTVEPQLLSLNSSSIVYTDNAATYDFDGSELVVKATLKPITSRLRFKGTSGTKLCLTGLTYYTTFYWANNALVSSQELLTLTVGKDGYTPYVYADFATTDRTLGLIGNGYAFTRKCSATMLKTGESGCMTIPSDASHDGWLNGLYVKASGVEFKMIPVAGHSDGFFLIGETEVTQELYYYEYGTTPYPMYNKSVSQFQSWMINLNSKTHLNFDFPTLSQWQYAAQGGNKKMGYTYSGSNSIDDVAWYSGNSSSHNTVKQKAPNELGIYDMSGNVCEFAYDEQKAQYVGCGGCYGYSSNNCLPSSYFNTSTNSYSTYYGLRLALKPNF